VTIPQTVIDALASIPAQNPLPDVTTMPISQASLNTLNAQLGYWTQVRDICKGQFDIAESNTSTLAAQAAAMAALLA